MSYTEFVWFLLSEEDKQHPTAIEYWFRCMDLDGDGYLSMYELEYFYEEQMQRMEAIGIETLPFQVMCSTPVSPCHMAMIFFFFLGLPLSNVRPGQTKVSRKNRIKRLEKMQNDINFI